MRRTKIYSASMVKGVPKHSKDLAGAETTTSKERKDHVTEMAKIKVNRAVQIDEVTGNLLWKEMIRYPKY